MSRFIEKVLWYLPSKKDRDAVQAELEDHFACKTALFEERGFDEDGAKEKAEEAFGDCAEETGLLLATVHKRSRLLDWLVWTMCMLVHAVLLLYHLLLLLYNTGFYPEGIFQYFFGEHVELRPESSLVVILSLSLLIMIAWRRRLRVPLLTAAFHLLLSLNDFLLLSTVLAETLTGKAARYLAYDKTYSVLANRSPLTVCNVCVTVMLCGLTVWLFLLACRSRKNAVRKTDARRGRAVVRTFTAIGLLTVLIGCEYFVLQRVVVPADHGIPDYIDATNVMLVFGDSTEEIYSYSLVKDGVSNYHPKDDHPYLEIVYSFDLFEKDSRFYIEKEWPNEKKTHPYISYSYTAIPGEEDVRNDDPATWDIFVRFPYDYAPIDAFTSCVLKESAIQVDYHPYCRVYYFDHVRLKDGSYLRPTTAESFYVAPGDDLLLRLRMASLTPTEIHVIVGEKQE